MPPVKVPTTCVGPQVRIDYLPKTCDVNSTTRQIICDPAKLVIVKIPGSCTLKHYTPFVWSGKQCRLVGECGFRKEKVIGGTEYTIDFTDLIHDKAQTILDSLRPDAPSSVAVSPVTGHPFQTKVVWAAADKAHLQGIMKYVLTCTAVPEVPSATRTLKVSFVDREAVLGTAATGENAALAPNSVYTCAVAAVNAAGESPETVSTSFTTPPAVR